MIYHHLDGDENLELKCLIFDSFYDNYKGAIAGVITGFVVDLGWLLAGLTASTGVFEIVPGFFASLIAAVLVAKFTESPNAEALEIFDKATSPDAD